MLKPKIFKKLSEHLSGIFFVVLLSLSSSVFGKWTQIYIDDNVRKYLDFDNQVKSVNTIKIWEKSIYLKPLDTNVGNISSTNNYLEVDCRERTSRTIYYEGYSDVLQQKLMEKNNFNGPWKYHRPNSIGFEVIRKICNF